MESEVNWIDCSTWRVIDLHPPTSFSLNGDLPSKWVVWKKQFEWYLKATTKRRTMRRSGRCADHVALPWGFTHLRDFHVGAMRLRLRFQLFQQVWCSFSAEKESNFLMLQVFNSPSAWWWVMWIFLVLNFSPWSLLVNTKRNVTQLNTTTKTKKYLPSASAPGKMPLFSRKLHAVSARFEIKL